MEHTTWQEAFVDVKAHAKSNTAQIREIKLHLKEINEKLDASSRNITAIKTVVVDNGLVAAVKIQAKKTEELQEQFNQYLIDRETSCPVVKRLDREKAESEKRKNWAAALAKVIIAGIGGLSTLIVIIQTLLNVMGG